MKRLEHHHLIDGKYLKEDCLAGLVLAEKIEMLTDFERCLVRDRLGAVLRYGKKAVVTPKQAEVLLKLKQKYSRTALDALGEDK